MGAYPGVYLRNYVPETNDAPGFYVGPGTYPQLPSGLYNSIQSITIAPFSSVVLYDGENYTGDNVLITNINNKPKVISNLGTMSKRVKSMKVGQTR